MALCSDVKLSDFLLQKALEYNTGGLTAEERQALEAIKGFKKYADFLKAKIEQRLDTDTY
jgi:hypothetical protein